MRISSSISFQARVLSALLALCVLSGCASVKFIADYDEQIDTGTTALQKDFETFLVKLESSAKSDDGKVEGYGSNKPFYSAAKVSISGLRLRADAVERNSLTVRMFDKLRKNLDRMEKMHSSTEGLTPREIRESLRGAFNAQFTAILTLELAKKRGEKPDETKAAAAPSQINPE
ncbi:MAG TPA: hypothetical protein VLI06_17480 [Solimonas sp.]|nr:hypothetical protein [Solimonas sp.]